MRGETSRDKDQPIPNTWFPGPSVLNHTISYPKIVDLTYLDPIGPG